MKLSELIKQIQDYIAENGDVEVLVRDPDNLFRFKEIEFDIFDIFESSKKEIWL